VKRVIIYTFYRGMSTIYKIIPLFDYYLLIGCCASLYFYVERAVLLRCARWRTKMAQKKKISTFI